MRCALCCSGAEQLEVRVVPRDRHHVGGRACSQSHGANSATLRLAVDTGGTHTDVVLFDEASGRFWSKKVPTTNDDLARGVIEGAKAILGSSAASPELVRAFCYGTTLVTNMIVQGQKVPVALITTKGFRDVLEIGRAFRKWNIYDIHAARPPALVPREFRQTVTERIDFTGNVIVDLADHEVRTLIGMFAEKGIESVAVVLLHSYKNPVHEQRIREILKHESPDMLVSLSSDVSPEIGEYERSSTTVLNAFVQRGMIRHLGSLTNHMHTLQMINPAYIMQCTGGLMGFDRAKRRPVMAGSSGPVAGVLGGVHFGESAGYSNLITLDMGGTSTDIAVIEGGKLSFTLESELEHYPLQIPAVDYTTIGAGGGSLIWVDEGGALRVGPRSAGAEPGPACYGLGGLEPTVTDANLLCGVLHPQSFVERGSLLDESKALDAMVSKVARTLDMSCDLAAVSGIQIAVANMIEGIKTVTVARGLDPRDYALVAFGGAGPMHASAIAGELGIPLIVVPPYPGMTSALGLLMSRLQYDAVVSCLVREDEISGQELHEAFYSLEEKIREQAGRELVAWHDLIILRSIDMRYVGQMHAINIRVDCETVGEDSVAEAKRAFHESHLRMHGHNFMDRPVQFVSFRVAAREVEKRVKTRFRFQFSHLGRRESRYRDVLLGGTGWQSTRIFARDELEPRDEIKGPAIVEQMDSTTLLLPGDVGTVDMDGNILIAKE